MIFDLALVVMYLRDWYDCYFLNLTRSRGIRKPTGYPVRIWRRPRWCPICLFRALADDRVQLFAYVSVLLGSLLQLRVLVAISVTIVELKFHAALGWHRCVLLVWTTWARALGGSMATRLAVAHSYLGSGLSRLRVARTLSIESLAAEAKAILMPARNRSLFPNFVGRLSSLPPKFLGISLALVRVGLEIIGIAMPRTIFHVSALCFHQAIAVTTSIDFFENKIILLVLLFQKDEEDSVLIFLFALALITPIVTMREDFPFTPNALFPFSAEQMSAVESLPFKLIASHRNHHVDLVAVFLQQTATQPAQLYHAEVWAAVTTLQSSRDIEAALTRLLAWLKRDTPLLTPTDFKALDTISIVDKQSGNVLKERSVT